MKTITPILLLTLSLLTACSQEPSVPASDPASIREIAPGTVIGFEDSYDTWSWRGIPFARPPLGDLRWRAPQSVEPWEGTFEALEFADMCPQLPIPVVNDTDEEWLGDEDCLYLNVSAPKSWSPGDEPLPVMLWLHGGGNSVGSADLYVALRNLAARERVITVSIHYRLGLLGWFSHPALRAQAKDDLDASGNFGTLDTIAALEWVRDNIHVFGGDPDNVTVFGESAGGMNTFALLLSPLAENLFHRAISQSGILLTTPLANAENTWDATEPGHINSSTELLLRLLEADGTAPDRASAQRLVAGWDTASIMSYLRAKPPEAFLQQVRQMEMGVYPFPTLLRDGVVLPAGEPLEQLERGAFNQVPVILGTNRDELKTLMLRNPDYTAPLFGMIPRVPDQAVYDRVTGYGSDMWKVVGADEPARAMRAAGHEAVFVYRFDWDDTPSNWLLDFKTLMGAGHGLEIPFVFYDIDNEMTYMPLDLIDDDNLPGAEPLAQAMSSYWGAFAREGNPARGGAGRLPAWLPWRAEENYLLFDAVGGGGIRMTSTGISRESIFIRLADDSGALGGEGGVCLAYDTLFGSKAIFGFTASCSSGRQDCAGDREHFCPPTAGGR